jgi:hypothetical protein
MDIAHAPMLPVANVACLRNAERRIDNSLVNVFHAAVSAANFGAGTVARLGTTLPWFP